MPVHACMFPSNYSDSKIPHLHWIESPELWYIPTEFLTKDSRWLGWPSKFHVWRSVFFHRITSSNPLTWTPCLPQAQQPTTTLSAMTSCTQGISSGALGSSVATHCERYTHTPLNTNSWNLKMMLSNRNLLDSSCWFSRWTMFNFRGRDGRNSHPQKPLECWFFMI